MLSLDDSLFVLSFVLGGGLIYLLLRIARERITRLTVISFLMLSLLVYSYAGIILLYFQFDEYRVAMGVEDKGTIIRLFFVECLALASLLTGVIVARAPGQISGHQAVRSRDCRPSLGLETPVLLVWLLVSLCWFGVYITKVENLALFVSFSGDKYDVGLARSAMGNDFLGGYHWYRTFMLDIGAFVAFAFYANWLVTRRLRHGLLFLMAFTYAAFGAVMAAEKAPFAYLVIGLFFCHALVRNGGVLPMWRLTALGAALVSVLVVFYIGFMGSEDVASALDGVFSRLFTGQITPAYFYLEFVPLHRDYYMGTTFPNPSGVFSFEPQRYTVEIMNWVFPDLEKSGVVGSMPTVFWGEAYLNFGMAGVLLVSFVVGVLLAILAGFLHRLELSPAAVAYTVWMIIHYASLSGTGFSDYLFDVSVVLLTTAFLSVIVSRGRGRLFATRTSPEGCPRTSPP